MDDQIYYFALDCPPPPVPGRYQLYIDTTIYIHEYLSAIEDIVGPVLQGLQSNWENPEAVTMNFNQINTPFITSINAVEGDPELSLNVTGVSGINSTSAITKTYLHSGTLPPTWMCSLPASPSALIFNKESSYSCQTVPDIPGGLYNFVQYTNRGMAYNFPKTSFYNFGTDSVYNVAIHPIILSISPNSGFSQGQIITLNGKGFQSTLSQVNVSFAGYSCDVQSSSFSEIKCLLPPIDPASPALVGSSLGSSGLTLEKFTGYSGTLDDLAKDDGIVPNSKKLVQTPETLYTTQSGFHQRLTSYFVAPKDGIYRFSVAANSVARVYIASSGSASNVVNGLSGIQTSRVSLVLIADNTLSTKYRDFSNSLDLATCTSANVSLVQGQSYLLTAVQDSTIPGTFLTLAVEIPSTEAGANSISTVQKIKIHHNYKPGSIWRSYCRWAYNGPWRDDFYRGNISFALIQLKYNDTTQVSPGFVTTGSFQITGLYDPNDPDVEKLSEELTKFAGGRKILVEKYPVCDSWANDWYCNQITYVYHCEQRGWGFKFTILEPLPAWWYDFPTSLIQMFVTHDVQSRRINSFTIWDGTISMHGNYWKGEEGTDHQPNYEEFTRNTWYDNYNGSKIVSGTWSFTYDGISSGDLPFDIDGTQLRDIFRDKFNLFVTVHTSGWAESGYSWEIIFDGYSGDAPNIAVNGAGLTIKHRNMSDPTDVLPTITVEKTQVGRTNVFLAPIPTEFLRVPVSSPEFIVYSGGVRSHVAEGASASYTVLQSPTVTSGSINGQSIDFTVTYPSYIPPPTDITGLTVTVDGVSCTVTQVSAEGLVCDLPVGTTPTAGPVDVKVYWDAFGYFATSSPLILTNGPTAGITGVEPTSAPQTGGTSITVTGTGFGSIDNTVVTLNGVAAEVVSVSSTSITFICPDLTSTGSPGPTPIEIVTNTISLTANGFSTYLSTAPSILSLNVTSISPVKTSYIQGTLANNPSTTASDYTAVLVSTDSTGNPNIPCYVFKVQSDSFVCAIAGGKQGAYKLVLTHATLGNSHETPAVLVQILVSSVSPTSGSSFGGTEITIQGENFSPVLNENQVYIGTDLDNVMCSVKTATTTQLTCTVGALQGGLEVGTPYQVRVFGRLQQEAIHAETFTFTFTDAEATITATNSSVAQTGDVVELTGTGLSQDGGDITVYLNNTAVTATFLSDTAIQFTVPELPASNYIISVLVPNKGYANSAGVSIYVPLFIHGLDYDVANAQGNRLVINGNGFAYPSVTLLETNTSCEMVSVTSTKIVCDALPGTPFPESQLMTLSVTFEGTAPQLFPITVDVTRTPKVDSLVPSVSGDTTTITVTGQNLTEFGGIPHLILTGTEESFEGTVSALTNTSFVSTFIDLPAAKYQVSVYFEGVGFAALGTSANTVTVNLQAPASNPSQIGFAGLSSVTYTGNGFHPSISQNDVRVCGLPVTVTSSSSSSLTFAVPPIVTPASQSAFSLGKSGKVRAPVTYGLTGNSLINDGDIKSSTSSTSKNCQVGLDFGAGTYVEIDSITIYPDLFLDNPASLSGAQIKGGNSTSAYTTLVTLDGTVQVGSNTFTISDKPRYRYVVFTGAYCRIAELIVNGIHYSATTQDVTSTTCNLDFYVAGNLVATLPNEFTLSEANTLTVTGVTPTEGPSAGGTEITITGTNFGSDASKLSVLVNDINCVDLTVNAAGTQITCTTGYAASYPSTAGFSVHHSTHGQAAINTTPFAYQDRWSSYATWGQLPPPTAGQIVHVPAGQRLLFDAAGHVDVVGFLIEGTIIFEDVRDYSITANWILVKGGTFQIGSATQPFQHNVQITLTGQTQDVQIPTYGNKVFAVRGGKVLIYGKPKTTWTTLTTTANAEETQITVADVTGWNVGDKIVISSTDFEHDHYDTATITSIAGNVVTLDTPLAYSHYSNVETYSTGTVTIAAEVGMLTRNIIIQGDSISENYHYGAHVLISQYGVPATAVFQYVEFFRVGQRGQKNRFPVNFVQIYDAPDSALVGCAIHRSYNRGVRVLQSSYIEFQRNVLFDIVGHGFYLESTTETFNNFDGNLVLGIKSNYFFETTDITAAAFFITNPQNYFANNVAAGSQYYGFAFSIKNGPKNTDAFVITTNVCPQGSALGLFTNNIAHSNAQEGLWIWPEYIPRKNPCGGNNWTSNPPVPAEFTGFLAYKHAVRAIYLYSIGDVRFQGLTLIDNSNEGFFVNYAGNSPDNTSQINNSLIIAYGQGNAQGVYTSKGVSVPASENFVVSNVVFVNFNETTMAALTTCTGGCSDGQARTVRVWGLTFENVAKRLQWRASAIFKTEDESLSGTIGWSIPNQKHNLVEPACAVDSELINTITCDTSVIVRRIKIYAFTPNQFYDEKLRVLRQSPTDSYLNAADEDYSDISYDRTVGGFVAPYILGYKYHVHSDNGTDFNRTVVQIESKRYENADPNVILEFNHTDPRELFDVYVGGKLATAFPNDTLWDISNTTYKMGNYTHNNETNLLTVVINYANNQNQADIRAIICRYTCPPPPPEIETDGRVRLWSNPDDWEYTGEVPGEGDEVVIPSTWYMILDVHTANLAKLEINGILEVLDPTSGGSASVSINAYNIWINGGLLKCGDQFTPYSGNFAINLLGDETNPYLVMDATADSGSKVFAVTGNLSLYGYPVMRSDVKLTSPAVASSSVIQLEDAAGMSVIAGDTLVIGPTGFDGTELEVVTVASVSGNTVTLTAPLKYNHWGGDSFGANYGLIDFAARVAKMNRNIQINGGSSSYGGRLYVTESTRYRFNETVMQYVPVTLTGSISLANVEIINFGQDGSHAGIHFDTVSKKPSNINGCTMRGGAGWGINVYHSSRVDIRYSVIVNPIQHAIKIDGGDAHYLYRNLVIGTRDTDSINGDIIDLIASIYSTSETTPIYYNTVAGSEGVGFVVVADNCDTQETWELRANSLETGVIFTAPSSSRCMKINDVKVFHATNGGINTYAAASELRAHHLILTDNLHGSLNLNLGGLGDLASAKIKIDNSYIGGTTFKTLDNSFECANISGIRVPVATLHSNYLPYRTWQQPYWSIRDEAVFATTFELEFVEFANFADENCPGLVAIETNPTASDASAVTSMSGVTTVNVDPTKFVNFHTADPTWVNDLICGNFQCTGLSNVLIRDKTGLFGNAPGVYIPNVPGIIESESTDSYVWTDRPYGVLAFDSLDSDNFTRLFSPITVTPYAGVSNYNNTLNAFRDHQYRDTTDDIFKGLQRLGRFGALLPDSASYNLEFTGTHPDKMRFQLLGSSNYVIVKTRYETPLMVTVTNAAGNVNPNILKLGQSVDLVPKKQLCGANNYYSDTRTIEFILNGDSNCVVTLQTQNSIYVTIRYQTTVDQFFSSNGPATFIDKLAAVVGVAPADVRVVNVVVGSAIVSAYIPIENAQQGQEYANTIIDGINDGQMDISGMRVLDMTYSIYTTETIAGGTSGSTKVMRTDPILSTTDIVLIVVGVLAFIVSIVVGVVIYKRIKRKMMEKKPQKGEWASVQNYSPQSSERATIKDPTSENDVDGKNTDIQIHNIGAENNSPRSNEELSPGLMKPANKRFGSIDLAPKRISIALNDSYNSTHELGKRNSDEEKVNESSMMAENFLRDLKQYETSQTNSESNSPLFKSIKKAEKLGEPKRKSQFGLSINTTEKRFSTLKRVADPEQKPKRSVKLTIF